MTTQLRFLSLFTVALAIGCSSSTTPTPGGSAGPGSGGTSSTEPVGSGGAPAAGGTSAGGAPSGGRPGPAVACGSATWNLHPFGCNFGWGITSPSGSLAAFNYVQLMASPSWA